MTIAPGCRSSIHVPLRAAGRRASTVAVPSRTMTSVPLAPASTSSAQLARQVAARPPSRCHASPPSRVQLDRLDDLVQVVRHLHRPVGERDPLHAPLAELRVERLRVGACGTRPSRPGPSARARSGRTPRARPAPITPSCTSFRSPATLAALAGSQPSPPAPTFAFASRISWSVASRTTPPHRSSAAAPSAGSPAG